MLQFNFRREINILSGFWFYKNLLQLNLTDQPQAQASPGFRRCFQQPSRRRNSPLFGPESWFKRVWFSFCNVPYSTMKERLCRKRQGFYSRNEGLKLLSFAYWTGPGPTIERFHFCFRWAIVINQITCWWTYLFPEMMNTAQQEHVCFLQNDGTLSTKRFLHLKGDVLGRRDLPNRKNTGWSSYLSLCRKEKIVFLFVNPRSK